MSKYIAWFKDIDKENIPLVGGKGANLGEMVRIGLSVPSGFIVTSGAYLHLLTVDRLREKIASSLAFLDVHDPNSLNDSAEKIKKEILATPVPKEIIEEIGRAYHRLGKNFLVAVRSSATAEDLPTASFAGQQRTYLNVRREKELVEAVRGCWASLFEPRAIFYREEQGFDHFKVSLAAIVQKMVQSDVSGVMFTLDPVTNDKSKIVIEAIYGLGEMIVGGRVTPDHYLVEKKNFGILTKDLQRQEIQLVKVGRENKEVKVSPAWQREQKLADGLIVKLAELGSRIEKHYFFPQDIEWAVEGNQIFILQTRPVTTLQKKEKKQPREAMNKLKLLITGAAASPGIGTGPVKIISSKKEINRIVPGDVLVAKMTNPDFVPAMRKAAAIVTDQGGRTSHAAIVSRELGVPCVVGTREASRVLKEGLVVTVDGSQGRIYRGACRTANFQLTDNEKRAEQREKRDQKLMTATKVYVNLGEPHLAAEVAQKNVDGVGLLRAEFMIAQIGVHPKKMLQEKRGAEFVDQLAEGLATICQAFSPRPVVYRASDFKTNEYRALRGGDRFEPEEENPFLGYRGCFRYLKDPKVFELELKAIEKVRGQDFRNLWLMLPFVRNVRELVETKKIVNDFFRRSPNFKLWLMVELPVNVILLEDFLEVGIDGVSIGTNDLTMLILGTDRDNAEVASAFNETNPAVEWALEKVIKTCRAKGVSSSICGQAPSVYGDLVEKLVDWRITSISVDPDAVERTREIAYQAERKSLKKGG